MRTLVFCLAAVTIIALTGCSTTDTSAPPPAPAESSAQALPSNYGATTCAQWANVLTPQQRHDSALDMLVIARQAMDAGTGTPSDALVTKWEKNLTAACPVSVKSLNIAGAAELLYRADEDIYSQ